MLLDYGVKMVIGYQGGLIVRGVGVPSNPPMGKDTVSFRISVTLWADKSALSCPAPLSR